MIWFLLIAFVLGELFYKLGIRGELTRKIVHVLCGLVVVLLPLVWNLPHTLFVGLLFTVILVWSEKKKLLKSVNAINRPTIGGSLFALGLSVSAAISWSNPLAFQVSALILTISDTAAWLAGRGYLGVQKPKNYLVSGIFGLSALCVLILIGSIAGFLTWNYLLGCLISVVILSAVEFNSPLGSDNFFVPVVAAILGLIIF